MKQRNCWSLVGSSPAAELIRNFVRVNSRLSTPVLLSGEAGVGKDRIARLIHQGSLLRAQPFQVVDCSELFSDELGVELFGCSDPSLKKPGILRELRGGTCYLARCEEIAPSIQVRLREYIEPGCSRLVFSSSIDMASFMRAGLFDRKLFDTFSGSLLAVGSLRKRQEDLGSLVDYYATSSSRGQAALFSPDALEALGSYPWPGNHRELEGEVNRLLKSVRGEIGVDHLSPRIANFWLGGRQDPDVRRVGRQLEECLEESRVLTRLDSVFGNLLLAENKWGDGAVNPGAEVAGDGS
ncbi:MAG: sigma 54-interacting transcriptional regulator [Planctomycetota bacterium]|nr:sigma 54-interacting transcriptional regulator [Planctomycetota bacterium]